VSYHLLAGTASPYPAAKITVLCCALGEFSPHSGHLASAGAPAHQAQVRPERFEVADPAEAKTRLVMGDNRGERLEEVVVVVPGVFKNNRARLLRAWRLFDLRLKVLDICFPGPISGRALPGG
jgi:hypothetical protein